MNADGDDGQGRIGDKGHEDAGESSRAVQGKASTSEHALDQEHKDGEQEHAQKHAQSEDEQDPSETGLNAVEGAQDTAVGIGVVQDDGVQMSNETNAEKFQDGKGQDTEEAQAISNAGLASADADIIQASASPGHQRQSSVNKVDKVENPILAQEQSQQRNTVPTTGNVWPDQQNYNAAVLRAEPQQHRHNVRVDSPASYQPKVPSSYLHIRAMALQLPASGQRSSSATQHIEPASLVFEARTNLSSARRSFYPRVTRTLPELQLWVLALTLSFPAGIFSPFSSPPATLVAGSATHSTGVPRTMDDVATRYYLLTITRQFDRILRKPYVLSHPATVALLDCDFSYHAAMPHLGPGSSQMSLRKMDDGTTLARMGHDPVRGRKGKSPIGGGAMSTWDIDGVVAALGLPQLPSQNGHDAYTTSAPSSSKNPLSIFTRSNASPQRITPQPQVPIPPGEEDEDEEDLTAARNEITRLELQFERAGKAAQHLVERNGAMVASMHQLKQAMNDLSSLDSGRAVARKTNQESATKALSHGIDAWSAATGAKSAAIMSTLAPGMAYQCYNARTAIDALLRRASAAAHRYSTLVVLVQRRREAERLKRARGAISQEEVDWVLKELRDAQRCTQVLTHHLSTFTATLKEELKEHSRNTHADIQEALLQHARSSMRAHRFMLTNLTKTRDSFVAMREGRQVDKLSSAIGELDLRPNLENETSIARPSMPNLPTSLSESSPQLDALLPARMTSTSTLSEHGKDKMLPGRPDGTTHGDDQDDKDIDSRRAGDDAAASEAPILAAKSDRAPTSSKEVASGIAAAKEVEQDTLEQVRPAPQDPHPKQAEFVPPKALAQSALLPKDQDRASPLPAQGDLRQDSPSVSSIADQSTSPSFASPSPAASQSMFLPGRNMARYSNPFARMDGGGGGFGATPSLAGRGPQSGIAQAHAGASGFAGSAFGSQSQSGLGGASDAGTHSNAVPNAAAGKTDPWANRSRISASDAARSLAGRF